MKAMLQKSTGRQIQKRLTLTTLFLSALYGTSLTAQEVKVAVADHNAPYTLRQGEDTVGIHIDIIKEALAYKGHTLNAITLPYPRLAAVVTSGEVDASAEIGPESGAKAYFSDAAVGYTNVVITLQSSQITVDSLDDLMDIRVLAFPNARKHMPGLNDIAESNPRYKETGQATSAVGQLYAGRIEALVWDKYVALYYRKKLSAVDTSTPLNYSPLWGQTLYPVAFVKETLRDDFNEGLRHMKATGRYQQILDDFSAEYQ